jgi:DNA-binding transcriptional ArsR family regulator
MLQSLTFPDRRRRTAALRQGRAYSTVRLTFRRRCGLVGRMTGTLDNIFAALADPTRRAILTMLLEDDMAVTDVAEPFAMSLAAISKHLQVLAACGLISQEQRGRVKWCRLEPDALREASVWMKGFGLMESLDLDAFERFLEQELSGQETAED